MTCGVPTIEAEHERVVDAAFVKKSEDGRTCTVRKVFLSGICGIYKYWAYQQF